MKLLLRKKLRYLLLERNINQYSFSIRMDEVDVIAYLNSDFHRDLVDFLHDDVQLPPDHHSVDTFGLAEVISDEAIAARQRQFGLSRDDAIVLTLQQVILNNYEGDQGMITDYFLMAFYRSEANRQHPRLAEINMLP